MGEVLLGLHELEVDVALSTVESVEACRVAVATVR